MKNENRNIDEILNNYFEELNKTDDPNINYENKRHPLDNAIRSLKADKTRRSNFFNKRLIYAAVFSVMSAVIIILSVLLFTAEKDLPPDDGPQAKAPVSYVVYNDVKLDTVSARYNILIPSYEFFEAPQAVSVLNEYGTGKDVFVKIQYYNKERNEALVFNIVLDSAYDFPELSSFQDLKKTGVNNGDIGEFKYDTKGSTAYAAFSYMNNKYYLQYTSDNGNEDNLAYIVKCLYKKYTKVDSVFIRLSGNATEIPYNKSAYLSIDILPYGATYQNYNYYVEKILKPDGSRYEGNLNKYAYIEQNGTIRTTPEIGIGAKIYIYALAETDRVKSNTLEIEIVRIPVDRIDFVNSHGGNDLLMGAETIFSLFIYPEDATFNYLNDSEILIEADESLVALTKINDRQYLLKASNNINDRWKNIAVSITADGFTKTFSLQFDIIQPQSIILCNPENGLPLEREIELPRNGILKTTALVTPENAHGQISYNYFSTTPNSAIYVSYDQNGILTIGGKAPFGMEIYISASQLGKTTGSYKIVVTKTAVTNVTASASQYTVSPFDGATMNIGSCLIYLHAEINPDNADIYRVEWKILNAEALTGVYISGNMLFASFSAPVGEIIELQAVADGIESNIIRILIVADSG